MRYLPDPDLVLFGKSGEIVSKGQYLLLGNDRFVSDGEEHQFHAVNHGLELPKPWNTQQSKISIYIDRHYYCVVDDLEQAENLFRHFSCNFLTPPRNKSRIRLKNIIANRVIQLTRIQDREINRQIMMDSDADWGSL